MQATLRTNFYQPGADGKPQELRVASSSTRAKIPDLPLPRPKFEIFVYSPRVEGVHLRMGDVARGGIRWSDRREDFRTEVLGLMKAQNVKNTVIVPVGAKGGFVPKRLPAGTREEIQAEVVACYQTFIRGLLDLTDNIVGRPHRAAAARGAPRRRRSLPGSGRRQGHRDVSPTSPTPSRSNTASGWAMPSPPAARPATTTRRWASPRAAAGSASSATSARSASTSSARTSPPAGIGDMSGDVFGNGMLLSRTHGCWPPSTTGTSSSIPTPDAAASFAERARLFALPRSSWDDYDRKKISRGGGVFARTAKSDPLSAEARTLLGLEGASAAPNEVIRAILRMPVDLLWNGGIGTYVKASDERNAEVGDRTNDAVRINGRELKAKVVGEGGNLGLSQRGRIEYALAGGRLNTDFIDNSAGVNTSDVEVNIKILLNPLVAEGRLTRAERNQLLARHDEGSGSTRPAQQLPAEPGDQHARAAGRRAPARVSST